MTKSKKERFNETLNKLNRTGDIEGSAIVTRDGLLISSLLPPDTDAETFAAMSATMIGAAETAVSELKKGTTNRVIVEGNDCKLIAAGVGNNAILVCMVAAQANLGFVLVEMKKSGKHIEMEL